MKQWRSIADKAYLEAVDDFVYNRIIGEEGNNEQSALAFVADKLVDS